MRSHNVYTTMLLLLYSTCDSICTTVDDRLGQGDRSDPHYIYSDGQTSSASPRHLQRCMYIIFKHTPVDKCPLAMCFSLQCCEVSAGLMYPPRSLIFIFIWPPVPGWSEMFFNVHVPYIEAIHWNLNVSMFFYLYNAQPSVCCVWLELLL